MVLGVHIRELRERSQLSLRQLDRASGVAFGTINRTELDKRVCTLPDLEGLAQAWGVSVPALLGWAEVETKYPARRCTCQPPEDA